jgi:mono/diheme cytochrome c family protein
MKRGAALIAVAGLLFGALLMVRLNADTTYARARQAPSPASATTPAAQSVWDGVYTLAQAKRGALKSGLCTGCHGDGFVGGIGPELAGEAFLARWEGRSVADLFDLIRLTMPDDDPGALPREQYADLIAYILAVNKFPEGRVEIGTAIDPLKTIRILAAKP